MRPGPKISHPVALKLLELPMGESITVPEEDTNLKKNAYRWGYVHGFRVKTYKRSGGGMIISKLPYEH